MVSSGEAEFAVSTTILSGKQLVKCNNGQVQESR